MSHIYFTVCAQNYLAYALTLRQSLLRHHPDARFVIFLADAPLDAGSKDAELIAAEQLSIDRMDNLTFVYDVMEFSTAIKPWCFEHLFEECGADAATYIDPDIFVFSPLDEIESALREGAEAVLTPHISSPLPRDGRSPGTRDILNSGVYNFGFLTLKNSPDARTFIAWWRAECEWNCIVDFPNGLFVDQKFGEFVPSFVKKAVILHHPGYNVAYWNLPQRPVSGAPGDWRIGDRPLVFFHFSGIRYDDPNRISKHQNRYSPPMAADIQALFEEYRLALKKNGHEEYGSRPYAFSRLPGGEFIPKPLRRYFRRERLAGRDIAPFEPHAEALNGKVSPSSEITRFMQETWDLRPDLKAAFDPWSRSGRLGFRNWFHEHAVAEGLATERYVPALGLGPADLIVRGRLEAKRVLRATRKTSGF